MTMYDFDEIKQRGDCIRFARDVLGATVGNDNRCAAIWRGGSRENSVSLEPSQWFDFAEGKGGSIIDLCAIAKFNGDIFAAASFLGEWLGLQPKHKMRQNAEIVATYDYADASGVLVLQVVRYKPKDFRQRRPDPANPGAWLWTVRDIVPPLYRLAELRATKWVCIVAGEKDADNLRAIGIPATCNAGGEGKWLDAYNAELAGKSVVIIADKDETGRKHAQTVAYALRDTAKAIRIIELPDRDVPVKDASDWIAAGGTRDELLALIKDTPRQLPEMLAPPRETPKEISAAKKANARAFSNYDWADGEDESGKAKAIKQPRKVMAMVGDLKTRFWEFPHRLGEVCFDHDRETSDIRFIKKPYALTAWIAEKSGHQLRWTRNTEGASSAEEFFDSVRNNSKKFNMISGVPHWPSRNDVYYTFGALPAADADCRAFKKLLSFFNPATVVDQLLLRVFFASPIYFQQGVPRPMWVIDSEHGQGVGKSKLVEMLARLYGDEKNDTVSPIYVDHGEINSDTQHSTIMKRLLSETARQKRILLLDNITGCFKSDALARLVTQPFISGLAPYGHTEETRPMDLTICLTSNCATMDRDIIHRSLFIHLAKPEQPLDEWVKVVSKFINENRTQILADIIGLLDKGATFKSVAVTRTKDWEKDIMFPMLGSQEAHETVWKKTLTRGATSDSTMEEADTIKAVFRTKLTNLGIDPESEKESVWIPSRVIVAWCRDSIQGFGGLHGKNSTQNIRAMVKNGTLAELSDKFEIYPHNGTQRTRGLMWNQPAVDDADNAREPHVLGFKSDGTIGIVEQPQSSDLGL